MKENSNGTDTNVGRMENSIEEDIEILEKNIKSVKENADMAFFESNEDYYFFKAVEHILSDYKRVLKENEELKNKLDNSRKANEFLNKKNDEIRREKSLMYSKAVNDIIKGWNLGDDFVPVQKVKDKIEEIQEEGYWLFTTDRDSDKCVEVLQELIKERSDANENM